MQVFTLTTGNSIVMQFFIDANTVTTVKSSPYRSSSLPRTKSQENVTDSTLYMIAGAAGGGGLLLIIIIILLSVLICRRRNSKQRYIHGGSISTRVDKIRVYTRLISCNAHCSSVCSVIICQQAMVVSHVSRVNVNCFRYSVDLRLILHR